MPHDPRQALIALLLVELEDARILRLLDLVEDAEVRADFDKLTARLKKSEAAK